MENKQILDWTDTIDTELVRYFANKDMSCNPLDRAMEYTVLAGGKRIRPLLVLAACAECGGHAEKAIPMSLAPELMHTYSLIHDDLPAMDNDEVRRGKPTNHVVFGEANAILAGDALQTEAFAILAETPVPDLKPERRLAILAEMASAVGRRGMVAGQVMDLSLAGQKLDRERLTLLHRRKTGALLTFCLRMGGHLADASPSTMEAMTAFARELGLLFQVVDDLLDEEGEALGKSLGKDAAQNKTTFLSLLGSEKAHALADELLEKAQRALSTFSPNSPYLAPLAEFVRHRSM